MLVSESVSHNARDVLARRLFRSRGSLRKWIDRAICTVPWILGALFGAVAIHLLAILALPTLWPGAPYRVLAARLPLGQVAILPRPEPNSGEPSFSDPYAAVALCRFDLSAGAMRIRAQADGVHPFSVSLRLTDGTIIYSGNDRDTPSGRFNLRIVTQKQADAEDASQTSQNQSGSDAGTEAGQTPDESASATDALRLVSPNLRGFVVFRVLASREDDYGAAGSALTTAKCAVEKAAP
jgi:uncharacterized membrane protein